MINPNTSPDISKGVEETSETYLDVSLKSKITSVQPMTGIVMWTINPASEKASIQLEYSYFKYNQIVKQEGIYNWKALEDTLEAVAKRGHQAIIRWHDTYVAQPSGVPDYIQSMTDYRGVTAKSEGKPTAFPDWSHKALRKFLFEFFTKFAEIYDCDPRIAFVQVGFGLWAEYHIYDGPMEMGVTFPDKELQSDFVKHLSSVLKNTPWMISVDAAGDHAPYTGNDELLALDFGLFDDSFNHKEHEKYNEPNWDCLGRDRWKRSPTGGEFSFFEKVDQSKALSVDGPHGTSFENHAAKFSISFMIGDNQPRYQSDKRICEAGMACGYKFEITGFKASSTKSIIDVKNTGIAPIYYDAYPAVNGVRAEESLKGLLPGDSKSFFVNSGGKQPLLTIESDRLVKGQKIEFAANL